MPGDEWQRFANLRAYYGLTYIHPGKSLLFMGGELAQSREWNHDTQLDWNLLDNEYNVGMQALVRDLNAIYKATPALHEVDFEPEGFEWISDSDRQNSVISFLRRAKDPEDFVVVFCNLTPVVRDNYQIGVPAGGHYEVVLNTDDNRYGGSGIGEATIEAQETPAHGKPYSLALTLPPLATIILKPVS